MSRTTYLDIVIVCSVCGAALAADQEVWRQSWQLRIEPCQTCLDAAIEATEAERERELRDGG